jgi:hypothetical protein
MKRTTIEANRNALPSAKEILFSDSTSKFIPLILLILFPASCCTFRADELSNSRDRKVGFYIARQTIENRRGIRVLSMSEQLPVAAGTLQS